jgi:hypothetical protein
MSENKLVYDRKGFEYEVRGICIKEKPGFFNDLTEDLMLIAPDRVDQRVYAITTKNKSVDYIIYSGISTETNETLESFEKVNVVMRWKTRSGIMYKTVASAPRNEDMFKVISDGIVAAKDTIFKLDFKSFTKDLNSLLA